MLHTKRFQALLLLLFSIIIPLKVWMVNGALEIPFADLIGPNGGPGADGWYTLSNLNHNAFHLWRSDPLLEKLLSFIPLDGSGVLRAELALAGAIFTLGMFFL